MSSLTGDVDYLPRSAWDARPALGFVPLIAATIEGTALHWPGMKSPIHDQARVAAALRAWQADHMDNPDKQWLDIAYQVAVDQAGRAWTLRGLWYRSAANGDRDVNDRYGAILLVLAIGEEPSEQLLATTRGVIADFRAIFPAGTAIEPHSAVRPDPTDCPGDPVRAAITRGDFEPRPTEGDGTMPWTDDQIERAVKAVEAIAADQAVIKREVIGLNARMGYVANDVAKDIDAIRDDTAGPD